MYIIYIVFHSSTQGNSRCVIYRPLKWSSIEWTAQRIHSIVICHSILDNNRFSTAEYMIRINSTSKWWYDGRLTPNELTHMNKHLCIQWFKVYLSSTKIICEKIVVFFQIAIRIYSILSTKVPVSLFWLTCSVPGNAKCRHRGMSENVYTYNTKYSCP